MRITVNAGGELGQLSNLVAATLKLFSELIVKLNQIENLKYTGSLCIISLDLDSGDDAEEVSQFFE